MRLSFIFVSSIYVVVSKNPYLDREQTQKTMLKDCQKQIFFFFLSSSSSSPRMHLSQPCCCLINVLQHELNKKNKRRKFSFNIQKLFRNNVQNYLFVISSNFLFCRSLFLLHFNSLNFRIVCR